jgi:pimeloyl-ACP methyl ester carboxylesterase
MMHGIEQVAAEEIKRMGKHFVLIHGAWHGGWAWEGVIRCLAEAGHTAEAPTLRGNSPGDDRSQITLESYVDDVVQLLRKQTEPVILVGHSSAGFLLQSAAPLVRHKIERLIFLNAWILPTNTAQFDLVPPDSARQLIATAETSPDKSVPVIDAFVRSILMAGDDKDDQDKVIDRLTPQPLALFTTPVNVDEFHELEIPKTVVHCRDDTSAPPGTFLRMAEGLGTHDLIEIDGGHESLVTHPARVAEALIRAAIP